VPPGQAGRTDPPGHPGNPGGNGDGHGGSGDGGNHGNGHDGGNAQTSWFVLLLPISSVFAFAGRRLRRGRPTL
jgi:hypothetical protein